MPVASTPTTPTTPTTTSQLPAWLRALLWVLGSLTLLAVFAMYLQPAFMLTLADQVWACF